METAIEKKMPALKKATGGTANVIEIPTISSVHVSSKKSKKYKKFSTTVVLEREMLRSKAYCSLTSSARTILIEVLCRRKFEKAGRRGKECWRLTNNGLIVCSYSELRGKYGFAYSTIWRSFKDLIDRGFLKIQDPGGLFNNPNKYALIDDWKK